MLKGEFNEDRKIEFYEVKGKPFDTRRLQAGMFMDRPDLWRKPRSNHRKRVAKEQERLNLSFEGEGD